jgi:hypothetical protein
MNERGIHLLVAHIRHFDPSEPTARERLDDALGAPLARKLVFALSSTPLPPRRNVLAA